MALVNHIILADDDIDHGTLFERILKGVDPSKTLSVVTDGEKLLRLLARVKPEILFLDLNMPFKNGIECLQEIRTNERLKDLKVVVYSSSSRMFDIRRSYLHKADLYMVKPFHTEHLHNALDIVLNKDMWQAAALKNHYYINNRLVPFTAQL
jgi:DNA-binding NarL/FixJ family response regulator